MSDSKNSVEEMLPVVKAFLAGIHKKYRGRALKKHESIETITAHYGVDCTNELAYLIMNDYQARPTCSQCGSPVSFFSNRYAKTCSYGCSAAELGTDVLARSREKYNVANVQLIPGVADKRLGTMQSKYGANVSPKHRSHKPETADILNKKGKLTMIDRHGVENPGQLSDHGEKIKNAKIKKYGTDKPASTPEWKSRIAEIHFEKIAGTLPETMSILDVIPPDMTIGEANWRYHLKCDCGHSEVMPSETLKFRKRTTTAICTKCTGVTTAVSLKEIDVRNFIGTIYDGPIISSDRKIIHPHELDIVLPDLKLAVEFCGLFFHSDAVLDLRGGSTKASTYHLNKLEKCANAGYRLIQIFEDEWGNKRDIVEDRLRHIIGKSTKRIFARKCKLSDVDYNTAAEFCEKHHIMGWHSASKRYALWFEGEIVALMTFCRPSRHKGHVSYGGGDWELDRFCSSASVIGGGTKLFSHFVKQENPDKVITYSDRRWNTGDFYEKLGFHFIKNTVPNYFYVQGETRIHRFKFRKRPGEIGSEKNLRKEQGLKRIYDCGSGLYVWNTNRS